MLKINEINVKYGNIHAINNLSFEVYQGEIVTLIGANGAGKTSILNTISGIVKPTHGQIFLKGKNIVNNEPHELVTMGMVHVPEGRHVFSKMSVEENLQLGAYTIKDKNQIEEDTIQMYDRFPRLKERRKQLAGTMSGGEQQMLAIARALMSRPELVLMDEPSMGLAPILVQEIFEIIKEINSMGTTVLLVEQNANMALQIADRAYVLETGNIILSGEAESLLNNDGVRKAYLGA
ncbi:MAG: ABC transporter ATP-binding protein [Cellulosilyticaceae bacterium]